MPVIRESKWDKANSNNISKITFQRMDIQNVSGAIKELFMYVNDKLMEGKQNNIQSNGW